MDLKQFQDFYISKIDAAWGENLSSSPYARESALHEMINYHYETGGKRLRALCVLYAVSEWGNNHLEESMPFAIAVEMLHNATLIHDDIQDGDVRRRGKPTLWKKFSLAQAINCGDLLFFEAQRIILGSSLNDMIKLRLLHLIQEKTLAVIEGQGKEFSLKEAIRSNSVLTKGFEHWNGLYEKMIQGKTSALFSLPLVGASLIASCTEAKSEQVAADANILGMAFQIQDDYVDLWGNKGRGEQGSDIAEGKISFPVVQFLFQESVPKDRREKFLQILIKDREHTTSEEIHWCIAELASAGIRTAAREKFFELGKKLESSAVLHKIFQTFQVNMEL